jgi:hypothetical protein
MLIHLLSLMLLVQATTQPISVSAPPTTAPQVSRSEQLAREIARAHGLDVWPSVRRIEFTFNVERDGKPAMSRRHDWDVRGGSVAVTVGDKTTSTTLANPTDPQAFAAWTNDSYWLLMPIKLLDGGVRFGPLTETRDMPPSRGRMTMSFEGVGLTPGDQYDLSIDLRNSRIDHWTYRPNAEKSVGFTWENYQDFNGLILSTEHKTDDGKTRIFITDVRVERD